MRLNRVFISEYKNLKDFEFQFLGEFIDFFVGKNGIGKSNFFEALIEIFRHLYGQNAEIDFSYELSYTIDDTSIYIKWDSINGKWLDTEGSSTRKPSILPEHILIYYSGHNEKILDLIKKNEDNHKRVVSREDSNITPRKFFGIDKSYKTLLLFSILIQPDGCMAKRYIKERLSISDINTEFKLLLQRPDYAKTKKSDYKIDRVDSSTKYWKAKGSVKPFLDTLDLVVEETPDLIRDRGYFDEESGDERYILFKSVSDFQEKFIDQSTLDVFQHFDNLKIINMLKSISWNVTLDDGSIINFDKFSDGQFQTIYIYALTLIFKEKNCISLLDEPDAFLHPEWKYSFLNQIDEIKGDTDSNNHILMTSHSASTMINHNAQKVNVLRKISGNELKAHPAQKRFAIRELASDLFSYNEKESILSILNTLQIEKKPVLFTEGVTDPIIIKTAWDKLFDEEIPFLPFYAFGEKQLASLLADSHLLEEMNGLPLMGLFDFDQAYNSWNGLGGTEEENDPYKGLMKKNSTNNVYAFMLPVPREKRVTSQVINPIGGTYKGNSYLTIELLFEHIETLSGYFEDDTSLRDLPRKFCGDKVHFAKEKIPLIPPEEFEVFREMFEKVKNICSPVTS